MTNIPEIGTLSIDRKIREERVERAQKVLTEIVELLEERGCALRTIIGFHPPGGMTTAWGVISAGTGVDAAFAKNVQDEVMEILDRSSCVFDISAIYDSMTGEISPRWGIQATERSIVC